MWSYVYNIVRIYSGKRADSSKVDKSMVNPESAPEPDPESLAKCSTLPLVTAGNMSQTNFHMNQLEIECTILDGKAKVILYINGNIMHIFISYSWTELA